MKFGPWEISDDEYSYISECGAYERGIKIKPAEMELDLPGKSATIQGSDPEPYSVTLEGCTCAIFSINGQPCKHMIRLAMELGYEFDVPVFDPYAASEYDFSEDLAPLIERWKSGVLTRDALASCITALRGSAKKSKKKKGRPKKEATEN